MRTIKASEATNMQIDWLVAKCEGSWILTLDSFVPNHSLGRMNFSTDWAQGGPIIEREGIDLRCHPKRSGGVVWRTIYNDGPTPLVAAMRCHVTSTMGETVEVPEELT